MLIGNKSRNVRVSIQHMHPALYAQLEVGDELVIYRNGPLLSVADADVALDHVLYDLHTRQLDCEEIDDGPTRLVWAIVRARDRARDLASAAE
jgi:hypothetical protein